MKNMNINFPLVDKKFIKAKIAEGFYNNATELVRDAVHRLREQDDSSKYARLMTALDVGERAIREGRTMSYTPELLNQIEQDARQHSMHDRKPNPDVERHLT